MLNAKNSFWGNSSTGRILFVLQSCLCELKWLPKLLNSVCSVPVLMSELPTDDNLLMSFLLGEYSGDVDVVLTLQSVKARREEIVSIRPTTGMNTDQTPVNGQIFLSRNWTPSITV